MWSASKAQVTRAPEAASQTGIMQRFVPTEIRRHTHAMHALTSTQNVCVCARACMCVCVRVLMDTEQLEAPLTVI